MALAVLGKEPDAGRDRLARRFRRDVVAADNDAAARRAIGAEDEPRQFGAAGTEESGESDDFPAAHREADVA